MDVSQYFLALFRIVTPTSLVTYLDEADIDYFHTMYIYIIKMASYLIALFQFEVFLISTHNNVLYLFLLVLFTES